MTHPIASIRPFQAGSFITSTTPVSRRVCVVKNLSTTTRSCAPMPRILRLFFTESIRPIQVVITKFVMSCG